MESIFSTTVSIERSSRRARVRVPEAFQSISIPQSARVWVGITGDSIINPKRRDACQLHSGYVSPARFLAATTPVATSHRRRRRPFEACCSPDSRRTSRRGLRRCRRPADRDQVARRRDARSLPGKLPVESSCNFLHVHVFLARWYVRRRLPFDEQLRQTSSGPRLRRWTLARFRTRARHTRRIKRRDARAPQSFLRGVCRVIQA